MGPEATQIVKVTHVSEGLALPPDHGLCAHFPFSHQGPTAGAWGSPGGAFRLRGYCGDEAGWDVSSGRGAAGAKPLGGSAAGAKPLGGSAAGAKPWGGSAAVLRRGTGTVRDPGGFTTPRSLASGVGHIIRLRGLQKGGGAGAVASGDVQGTGARARKLHNTGGRVGVVGDTEYWRTALVIIRLPSRKGRSSSRRGERDNTASCTLHDGGTLRAANPVSATLLLPLLYDGTGGGMCGEREYNKVQKL
eukprot:Hpha_TRINITY_DN16482_c0_g7::TRINITY_DN16482_c0_g7_i1::g.163406::m.163406